MATVLVTDGTERSALAVVRSLGRAGHTVVVCAARPRALAAASRWCAAEVEVPDPLRDRAAFARAVAEAAIRHGADIALPVTDASVLALLADPPATALVPMAGLEAFQRISDKAAVATAGAEVGLRVPRQLRLQSPSEAAALADILTYPVVLKPGRSVDLETGAKHGVVHAEARHAFLAAAARLLPGAFPVLVQERIAGPSIGIFLLTWHGALLAAFAHRRLREKPPAGGVSVYCESIGIDGGLLERARALVDCFGWNGVAMVECKVDAATGEPVLMEINGRFWGSLQLAVDAGVDFPRLLLECALGGMPAPVTDYRVGVRNRWFWGDADHLFARLRHSAAALNLPPGSPGRLRAAGDFVLTGFTGACGQVFQPHDPGPAARELRDRMREVFGV